MYKWEDVAKAIELTKKGISTKEIKKFFNFENEPYNNPYDLLNIVCNYFNVHPKLVTSNSRDELLVKARKYFSYFACKKLKIIQEDAAFVLQKNRSSLAYYNKTIQGYIDIKDPEALEHIKNITKLIN